jgi:sulfofructose kinase
MPALMSGRIEMGTDPFVMCVGAAALDLVLDVEALPSEDGRTRAQTAVLTGGGPAATAAVALSRLGTRVAFVGSVGDDHAGQIIRSGLAGEDVDVTLLSTVEGATSPMSAGIVRSTATSRTLVAYSGSAAGISVTPDVEAMSRVAAWIHADHAGFAVVRELRQRGVETLVSVDGGNPIADLDLALVDLYVPASSELLRWTGASTIEAGLEQAYDFGVPVAIATHGGTGSTAISAIAPDAGDGSRLLRAHRASARPASSWMVRQPAFPVAGSSGSTLGAGDVFHGGLLAAIVAGCSLRASMAFASAAAALACRAIDGRSAIPTRTEVDRLIQAASSGGGQGAAAWS